MSKQKLSEHERMERRTHMSNAVFDERNLAVLKEGFNALYSIWEEVAKSRAKGGVCDTIGIQEKLDDLTKSNWNSLQNVFIKDPYHGYKLNDFKDDDDISAKLIMDLVNVTTQMNSNVGAELRIGKSGDAGIKEELRKTQNELTKTRRELADAKWHAQEAQKSLNTTKDSIDHLESKNREKADTISQLQRDGTVQLWEREKTKFLEKSGLKVKDLEKEIEMLRSDRKKLQDRVNVLDENLKMERMKGEVMKGPSYKPRSELEDENESLKRTQFLMEKDIHKLDMELYTFHKATVGILQGLREDYVKTFGSILDGKRADFDEDDILRARSMMQILRKTHEAARYGKLSTVRADLPNHYIGIDSDVKECMVKRISGSNRNKLPAIHEQSTALVSQDANSASEEDRLAEKNRIRKNSEQAERRQSLRELHPQLVNPETNHINMIKVMTKFHSMTEDFVREHWEQFKKYDTNGDGTLDLSEMMHAMMNTVGNQFTALQIQETMLEVDVDGSDDIDFYEYLCVANMVQNKIGKSSVFKSKLVQQEGRSVSKTCVVM